MSRQISDILGAPEPDFTHRLHEWEKNSGLPGHDLRLLSEIAQARKRALRELKLDENDTTAKELYYTLKQKAEETSRHLETRLGLKPDDTPDKMVKAVVDFINQAELSRDTWAVKPVWLKQLLKKQPPKKLLKTLGLRSIDSVLKRTSPCEVLTLACHTETPEWSNKVKNNYKKIKPSDFQSSKIGIYYVGKLKADKLRKSGLKSSSIVLPNYETSSAVVLTPASRFKLDALAVTLALLHSMHEMKVYSAYFRHMSVRRDFGIQFAAVVSAGLPGRIQDMKIGWKSLQRHFNDKKDSFEDFEQPHLQFEDIKMLHPVRVLAADLPVAAFWQRHDYVFMNDDRGPVSFHLMDVVVNTSNDLAYEQAVRSHLRNRLWEELGARYLTSGQIKTAIIESLDKPIETGASE